MDAPNLRVLKNVSSVYGWFSLLLFTFLMFGITFQWSVLDVGGALHFMIWDKISDHVAPMLLAVYIVWSIYIIRVARDPLANILFLDFTAWANVAHGLVMLPHAIMLPEYYPKLLTDIPMVLISGIAWLLVRKSFTAPKPAQG